MTIDVTPSLPDYTYAEKVVTFSEPADIQEVLDHLRVMLSLGAEYEPKQAFLESLGSGVIGIKETQGDNASWELRGDGSDITYQLYDVSSGHGLFVYSFEWV